MLRILPLFLLLFCGLLNAEETTLPATAKNALDKANADIAKVRVGLIKELTKAQDAVTKKGDLEGAMAIKAEIEKQTQEISSLHSPQQDAAMKMQTANSIITKGLNEKEWDKMPGETIEITAITPTVIPASSSPRIIVPHPTDTWNNNTGDCSSMGNGRLWQGLPMAGMIAMDEAQQKTAVGKGYVLNENHQITITMNDGNLTDNSGKIRVKICMIK